MALNQNQFAQSPYQGMVDQRYSYNTKSVQLDASEPAVNQPGTPVKMVDSLGGVPKVLACTDKADKCIGFINFDMKSLGFKALDMCEISSSGNVIYLTSTGAIPRGSDVVLDISGGGVAATSGSTGARVVGNAYDKFPGAGALGRVTVREGGPLDSTPGP